MAELHVPPYAELTVGQTFAGRYRIDKQVSRGGVAAIYLATELRRSRAVALKVLHGDANEVALARFQREARLIAHLQHPHIVALIDFGEDHGRLFLVMEYIDGEPLTTVMQRDGRFETQRVADAALQIAGALAVAHDMSVVHRDVKPDNIMVLKTADGRDFIKLLDFGIAKNVRARGANAFQTSVGVIVGSLRYISPEQVSNGEITPRADMYSFGCVLYEMLAGHRLFDYPSPGDCAIAHIAQPPPRPVVDGRALEGPLIDFVMRCLAKKPADRPANARDAIEVLMGCGARVLSVGRARPRALIIERSKTARAILRTTLDEHFDVVEVDDAEPARRALAEGPVALVVSQQLMPGGTTGIDLCEELRAQSPRESLTFALLAADSNPELERRARAAGVDAVVRKDEPGRMIGAIRTLATKITTGLSCRSE